MFVLRIELGVLQTRVARRLLFLFVLCALLPVGVLVGLAHRHVTRHLQSQSEVRLTSTAEAMEAAFRAQLTEAERELALIASIEGAGTMPPYRRQRFYGANLRALTDAVLIRPGSGARPVFGSMSAPVDLDRRQVEQLHAGSTVLLERERRDSEAPVREMLLGRRGDPSRAGGAIIWARVDTTRFWAPIAEVVPADGELAAAVVRSDLSPLMGAVPDSSSFHERAAKAVESSEPTVFEWTAGEDAYRAAARPLDMGRGVLMPRWHVTLSQSQAIATAPLREFTASLLPLALSALLIVLLLSDAQIKRTIHPLTRLREATRRVEEQDFDGRVEVNSRDEFQELADSFNSMTEQLGAQIRTLSAINQVDRTALTASAPTEIVDALLEVLLEVVQCEAVAICLLSTDDPQKGRSYGKDIAARPLTLKVNSFLPNADLAQLRESPDHLTVLAEDDPVPAYAAVPPFTDAEYQSFLILPIILDGEPAGAITYARREADSYGEGDVLRARQVADQAALALSNVRRLEDLEALNWGTLTALARAIDAASGWTAGHSERVSRLAAQIGELMELDAVAVESIRKGALLHDIGKIGVGVDIVNKSGPLSEEESRRVREHVTVGARILEPIRSYADLVPLIRSHHERWDGQGYPDGLEGDAIDIRARILSVADAFDALTSDRPYRLGLPMKTAIEVVKNASGSQFDPAVVDAFMRLVDKGDMDFQPARLRRDGTAYRHDHEIEENPMLARLTGVFEL